MPILWRYLLKNYFQVFFLCMIGFISVLLVTRVQEIARLAALTAQLDLILLFTLCQIPHILPIAIPISGLISAILLAQRLSQTHELTAFRASGLSVKMLSTPILMAAALLSVVNFVIAAELTPRYRLYSRELIQNVITANPLFLMKKSKLLKLQDSYVDMKMTQIGKEAKDVIFAVKNPSNNRLTLMMAKKFAVEENVMTGENVTIISNIDQGDPAYHDNLIIENQERMSTSALALSSLMQKTTRRVGFEYLPLRKILSTFSDKSVKPKTLKRAKFEICRRLFYSCITFTFTYVGISLGMQIGRGRKKRGIFVAVLLASFTFVCSIAAKSFHLSPHKMIFFYSIPIPVLLLVSLWFKRRILRGVE
ncbi:MAG: hypothetical protein K1060chlam2_00406 [Chlamydiae bacterium]|nr:hypothetical protein [Chlamydiota bacterium]